MIAYYFRVAEEKEPDGWIGLVVGQNMEDIFWGIDEYIDPYQVEIKTAHRGGYCRFIDKDEYGNYECDQSKSEFSQDEPLFDEKGWRTPKWITKGKSW